MLVLRGDAKLLLLKTGLSLSIGARFHLISAAVVDWRAGKLDSLLPALQDLPNGPPITLLFRASSQGGRSHATLPMHEDAGNGSRGTRLLGKNLLVFKGAQRHTGKTSPPDINLQRESCHQFIKLHNTSQHAIASLSSDTDFHFLFVQVPLQACSKSSPLAFAPSSSSSLLLSWA